MLEPLYEVTPGASALLISMPHSGTHLPSELAPRISAAARDVPDTDWFIPELYAFAGELGASVIRATHSRYVVDLNRPPDGTPLYPGRRETGVCPVETFDGELLYTSGDEPSQPEIVARLQRYWRPYHDRLAALIAERVARHGHCLLWDAHSIHSTVPGLFEGRLPDLNLGTADGHSCSAKLGSRLADALRAQRQFTFVVNGRFKGGYITRHYGKPEAGVEAVQMEIAQAAYLVEARRPLYEPARALPLQSVLRGMLSQFGHEA
ncbi:MAG: N-formylglutamate deformylase [Steroidobacterales bacterium]